MIQSFKMALRSIGANKMRAALTMLDIIIGVMALVVLVSLVNGATSSVTDAVSGLGSTYMTVTVSDDKGRPITLEDVNAWMEDEPSLKAIAPLASDSLTMKYSSESGSATVYGTTPAYYDIEGMELSMGRFLKNTDVENHSRVCVINQNAATELIGYEDCVGEELTLGGVKYTVVGVLADDDDSLTSLFSSGSLTAYVPYTSLIRLSGTVTEAMSSLYVGVPADGVIADAETAMTDILMARFGDDEDAFSVSSQNRLEETLGSITSVLTILLGGIAGISLLMGGIGIMNIMLVTVTERTREIGIRKAIGASRGTILTQFLIEAVVLCMLGCALGIFLSWAILRIISVVVSSLSITFELQGGIVLLSVVFCFIIGVVFGLYPANKAAKMKPIDALHYGG